jgi:prepilin-type N-terminal cleavage/methylation domain-containing protein
MKPIMNGPKVSHSSIRNAAFTLIELLTVITIIAILAGLVFAAGPAIMNQARKSQAKTTAHALVAAIQAYHTEYGRYPMEGNKQGFDTIFGNPAEDQLLSTNDLLATLLAEDTGWNAGHKLNPKEIVFFKPKPAKPSGETFRNGLGEDGRLHDPWGNEFLVMIDGDYDKRFSGGWFENIFQYEDAKQEFGGVIVWSYGKDGEMGKKGNKQLRGSDDVATWK